MSAKERKVKKSLIATTASLVFGLAFSVSALAVDGEVKKIDADVGKITLKHGEIKSLDLPAMQMAFRVANPAWLKSVQVGDKVNFSAEKSGRSVHHHRHGSEEVNETNPPMVAMPTGGLQSLVLPGPVAYDSVNHGRDCLICSDSRLGPSLVSPFTKRDGFGHELVTKCIPCSWDGTW